MDKPTAPATDTATSTEVAPTNPAASTEAALTEAQQPQEVTPTGESPSWMESLEKALDDGKITLKKDDGSTEKEGENPDKSSDKSSDKSDESSDKKPEDKDDDIPKTLSPKAADHFKAIKAAKAAAEARAAELEAKLKEVESAPKPDAEQAETLQEAIKEREAKIAEYEKELSVSRIEATPEYKENVVKPMAAILDVVERIAKKYEAQGVTEKKLRAVLEESDPDRQGDLIEEVASEFKERDRVSLYNLADDFSAVLAERDNMREKAAQILAVREKEAKAAEVRKVAEAKSSWEKTTKKVWETLKEKLPLPLEGEDLTTTEKAIMDEVAQTDFSALSDDLKAFAAFSGATIPHIVKHSKALEAKVAELETALKKYRDQTPGSDAGHRVEDTQISGDVGFLEAIEKNFR
jgi:hypothetical protein